MPTKKDLGASGGRVDLSGLPDIAETLINHSNVGIWILEGEGNILFSNPAAEKIWFHAPKVKRGDYQTYKAWDYDSGELIGLDDWPAVKAMKSGEPVFDHLMKIERFDGEPGYVLISAVPVKDKNGKVDHTLVMVVDVTELKAKEARREDFLRIASHDLKNPLHAIHMSSVILLSKLDKYVETKNVDKLRSSLTMINAATEVCLDLVRGVLDKGSSQNPDLELNHSVFSPKDLVTSLRPVYGPLAEQKKLELNWFLDEEDTLNGDKERLSQVLSNLLGNAIKFTPSGGAVTVTSAVDGDNMRFTVMDTGPGISKELLQKIFQKNFQSPEAPLGTGLGLYIARMMVEAHGGRIWAESTTGKGSIFNFTIPRRKHI